MDLYLNLLSNNGDEQYKSNKFGSWKTRLQQAVVLGPDTKLCLKEISFDKRYVNRPTKPPVIEVLDFLFLAESTPVKKYGKWEKKELTRTEFSSPSDLCKYLNVTCMEMCKRLRKNRREIFYFDKKQGKIWVHFENDFVTIILSGWPLRALGCESITKKRQYVCIGNHKRAQFFYRNKVKYLFADDCQQKYKSEASVSNFFENPPNLARYNEMGVHLSCVEPQFFCNSSAKVVRFVSIPQDGEDHVTQTFSSPLYISLDRQNLSELHCELKDIDNNVIEFASAVRVCFHLKDGV